MIRRHRKKLDRATTFAAFKVLLAHARRYPRSLFFVLMATFAVGILQITTPWFYKLFFDTLAANFSAPTAGANKLISILFILLALKTLTWFLRRCKGFASIYIEARVMQDLTLTSFRSILHHSYRFFTDNFAGSLTRKVNRIARAFEDIMDQIEFQLLPIFITVSGVLLVLFWRHWTLGLILGSGVLLFFTAHLLIAGWKHKFNILKAEKDSEATGVLADALSNAVTIKTFSSEEREDTLYQKVTGELRRLRSFAWNLNEWIEAVQGAIMITIEFLMLYATILLWKKGLVTIGDFVLIQTYLLNLFDRMWDFGKVLRKIYEGIAEASEMVEILKSTPEVRDRLNAKPLAVKRGEIEFRGINFYFHGTRKILENFNLMISSGEKVALVGPSGAGKTTVTHLLLRFYDVDRGEILIDGVNIAGITQKSLRSQIALVPQEPILFHRTLEENIRYGRPEASYEEVIEAAKKAHCHDFISDLPYGYDTYVGERGIKLSGGERQRVAIARAILKNAPILILDEATSSLDSESEKLIQEALHTLMRGRTTIVIAHRLSTIKQMDRIVIIDEGKILAEGTHDELLEREGIYKTLWEIQAGGFIPLETDHDQ